MARVGTEEDRVVQNNSQFLELIYEVSNSKFSKILVYNYNDADLVFKLDFATLFTFGTLYFFYKVLIFVFGILIFSDIV